MAEFLHGYDTVCKNEGGYVNDPTDNGGETYCGISRKNFPNWDGWDNVDGHKPLAKGEVIDDDELESKVKQLYKREFWDKMKGDGITSQALAVFLFDWYVNSGSSAIKAIQRIAGVTDDGIFGSGTLQAVNELDENKALASLKDARLSFYAGIVQRNPTQKKFIKGWNNRANTLYDTLA